MGKGGSGERKEEIGGGEGEEEGKRNDIEGGNFKWWEL